VAGESLRQGFGSDSQQVGPNHGWIRLGQRVLKRVPVINDLSERFKRVIWMPWLNELAAPRSAALPSRAFGPAMGATATTHPPTPVTVHAGNSSLSPPVMNSMATAARISPMNRVATFIPVRPSILAIGSAKRRMT